MEGVAVAVLLWGSLVTPLISALLSPLIVWATCSFFERWPISWSHWQPPTNPVSSLVQGCVEEEGRMSLQPVLFFLGHQPGLFGKLPAGGSSTPHLGTPPLRFLPQAASVSGRAGRRQAGRLRMS